MKGLIIILFMIWMITNGYTCESLYDQKADIDTQIQQLQEDTAIQIKQLQADQRDTIREYDMCMVERTKDSPSESGESVDEE